MSHITVNSNDKIFEQVLRWMERRKVVEGSRYIRVKSRDLDPDEVDIDEYITTASLASTSTYFNYGEWEARSQPRFEPELGTHNFWWRGNYFIFHRQVKKESGDLRLVRGGGRSEEREYIKLTCLGRSTTPIKVLLQDAKMLYLTQQKSRTKVLCAVSGRHWEGISSRPSRPMATVCLDEGQKSALLDDVNRFLNPVSQRWYAQRGIPYRRGYLFHGPPGTGKTSTAFALAGVFGLDIHFVSLMDSTMTEENLTALFKALPRRCVVLLEDIDTAMVNRADDRNFNEGGRKAMGRKSEDALLEENGISLSGLLNAIDGVASHEGRILVMTSNYANQLDDALIRPGRVDLQIFFGLATRHQMYELFIRMFTDEHDNTKNEGLEELGEHFAASVPDEEFSPAEIQGYLLMKRGDKFGAVTDALKWVEKTRTETLRKTAREKIEKKRKEERQALQEKEDREDREREKKEQEDKEKEEQREREKEKPLKVLTNGVNGTVRCDVK